MSIAIDDDADFVLKELPVERLDFDRRLRALEKDMWVGNGKPGITTRMAIMEDVVGKISRNLSKIIWLLMSILAAVVVKFFVK